MQKGLWNVYTFRVVLCNCKQPWVDSKVLFGRPTYANINVKCMGNIQAAWNYFHVNNRTTLLQADLFLSVHKARHTCHFKLFYVFLKCTWLLLGYSYSPNPCPHPLSSSPAPNPRSSRTHRGSRPYTPWLSLSVATTPFSSFSFSLQQSISLTSINSIFLNLKTLFSPSCCCFFVFIQELIA